MNIYKYIDFKENYWFDPICSQALFFPSIQEIQEKNDPMEFRPEWGKDNEIVKLLSKHFLPAYNKVYSKVRILCVSESLSKCNFDQFCGTSGGVCYHFNFNETNVKKDIAHNKVKYIYNKKYSLWDYVSTNSQNTDVCGILKAPKVYSTPAELKTISDWILSKKDRCLIVDHSSQEIPFRKEMIFESENEYRFLQLSESINEVKVPTKFIDGKLSFEQLGLTLKTIYTSDLNKVQNSLNNCTLSKHPDLRPFPLTIIKQL